MTPCGFLVQPCWLCQSSHTGLCQSSHTGVCAVTSVLDENDGGGGGTGTQKARQILSVGFV